MSLITSITKDLSKVKSDISNDYLDRTEGVKKGNLTSIMPSYKFSFADGKDAKAFDIADIVLHQRQKSNGQWTDKDLPCFAIQYQKLLNNLNLTRLFITVCYSRNTSSKEIIDEFKSGMNLNKVLKPYIISSCKTR